MVTESHTALGGAAQRRWSDTWFNARSSWESTEKPHECLGEMERGHKPSAATVNICETTNEFAVCNHFLSHLCRSILENMTQTSFGNTFLTKMSDEHDVL